MSAVARMEPLDQFCLGGLAMVLPVVLLLYAYGYEQHKQARRAAEVSVPACGADDWACELGQAYAGGWRPPAASRRGGALNALRRARRRVCWPKPGHGKV